MRSTASLSPIPSVRSVANAPQAQASCAVRSEPTEEQGVSTVHKPTGATSPQQVRVAAGVTHGQDTERGDRTPEREAPGRLLSFRPSSSSGRSSAGAPETPSRRAGSPAVASSLRNKRSPMVWREPRGANDTLVVAAAAPDCVVTVHTEDMQGVSSTVAATTAAAMAARAKADESEHADLAV